MKVAFFGSPEFAAIILQGLVNSDIVSVVGIVTQPDKQAGRGRKPRATPVKELALKQNIPILQPHTLKDERVIDSIRSFEADLFVVAAYGLIIPRDVLNIPRYGAINVHGSLLPKYRGAAPIQWAVLNGEKVTGITIMQMDEGLDTGHIILQRSLAIGIYDTAQDLHNELAHLGSRLLIEAIEKIRDHKVILIPQDESLSSYAPKLSKDMGEIDWNMPVLDVHNKIRGLYPWPMAFFNFQLKDRNIRVQVFPGKLGRELCNISPGSILGITDGYLEVACKDRSYLIPKLKPESSKILSGPEFWCGYVGNR